ncbi:peptidase S8/S53 domain-containing protein [Ochromonadaceae sp. CCMP2298]|nr:peptidase S8/S53 domain-containing protein [Ochromonadaceae sp. CCMP2298]
MCIKPTGSKTSEPYTELGLDGSGIIIGVSDTGIDEASCYFWDSKGVVTRSNVSSPVTDLSHRKVVQYITYSESQGDYTDGHGSHVAGELAGTWNPLIPIYYRGMASGAKLAFFDIGTYIPFIYLSVGIFGTAYAAGARVHSNSWGGGYLYDAFTIETDRFLYEKGDFLAIFAGGNAGSAGASSVVSPGLSKNALAVACTNNGHSTQSVDHISTFSSQGPTQDGRIKPDISAPGNSITSVKARSEDDDPQSCAVESKSGTSMAAPVVAGSVGLMLQVPIVLSY